MPKLLGITPEYGIPSQEDGLLLDSFECSWQGEWYDQKNNRGRVCGKLLVDEHVQVSISGAVALGAGVTAKGGHALTLANAVPDIWCETPDATTAVVTDISHSFSNSDARKVNLTVSVYAFGSGSGDDVPPVVPYTLVTLEPEAGDVDNLNAYGFAVPMSVTGELRTLKTDCRAGGTATGGETWAKLWRGSEFLGLSLNSQAHGVGNECVYQFDGVAVQAGDDLRVSFHHEDGKDSTAYQMGVQCCFRSVAKDAAAAGGTLNSQGGIGMANWQVKYSITVAVPNNN